MSDEADAVHGSEAGRWGGWKWRKGHRGEHFRRCSYCGSVNPVDLVAEPAWRADWADMKYGWPHKFYVDIPNREPATLYVVSATFTTDPGRSPARGDIAWEDLTPEQMAAACSDGYDRGDRRPTFIQFGHHANHGGKFYTAHLADRALDPAAKAAIEERCGLRFTFNDGRVSWASAHPEGVTP
jgi:hypothetical protein